MAGACAHQQEAPRGPVVRGLELEGAHQVSARDVKKRIATSETGWWWHVLADLDGNEFCVWQPPAGYW